MAKRSMIVRYTTTQLTFTIGRPSMYVDCLGESALVISVEIITVGLWLNSTMILELSVAVNSYHCWF
jgi:hypothetical protein